MGQFSYELNGLASVPKITQKQLHDLLTYDPATGVFRWRNDAGRHGRISAGTQAGCIGIEGYRLIGLGGSGRTVRASHLAWLYMTGEWPTTIVDHKNRDESDDRWDNLRLASHQQSKANTGVRKDSRIGLKGVCFDRQRSQYRAKITVSGRTRWLGRFKTAEEASRAFDAAHRAAHGDFSHAQGEA